MVNWSLEESAATHIFPSLTFTCYKSKFRVKHIFKRTKTISKKYYINLLPGFKAKLGYKYVKSSSIVFEDQFTKIMFLSTTVPQFKKKNMIEYLGIFCEMDLSFWKNLRKNYGKWMIKWFFSY